MAYLYPAPSDAWNIDRYRCAEVDGEGDRCRLVIGHDGQTSTESRSGGCVAGGCGAADPAAVGDRIPPRDEDR